MNPRLHGSRKKRPHVRKPIDEQAPATRRLTQLGHDRLGAQQRRHPHPATLPQCCQVVLGEKQTVLDGMDPGRHGDRWNVSRHGVYRDTCPAALCCSDRLAKLRLVEVPYGADSLSRPVPDDLDPTPPGRRLCSDDPGDVAGVDLPGKPGEVAALHRDDARRRFDVGTLVGLEGVDHSNRRVIGPAFVEQKRHPGGEGFLGANQRTIEVTRCVFEVLSSEMGVGVDQPWNRPLSLTDGLFDISRRLGPHPVDDVAYDRIGQGVPQNGSQIHDWDANCRCVRIMNFVNRVLIAVLLLAVACSGRAAPTTTAERDVVSTTFVAPTTTIPSVDLEVQNCSTPPVTFSPLCEIYELLETWYVDAPIDPAALAGVAVRGLEEYVPTETEEPPRTLFCAIPHEAFVDLCEELVTQIETSEIAVGPAVEAAMLHMIDVGLDPFTYYLPPGQTGSVRLNGIVGGIGVVLDARDAVGSKCSSVSETCRLEVVVVLEGNPGFEAGLQVGDVITAVDGDPVAGRGFTAIVAQIAGDETGTVGITVDRAGTTTEFSIERAELSVPTVEYANPVDGVGYIRIPDFEFDIPTLVQDSLAEITAESPGTIVVDLRDNPGGYVDAVIEVIDEFVEDGVVMVSDAPDEHFEYTAEPGGEATGQRLVVLVNQGTASAAEVLAGALRDRRSAVIVGTNTFGKDAVQIPFTLRNGGELYVAVARWSTPNGDTAGGGGLSPDREITWPTGATVEEIVEIALNAAS